MFRPLYFLTTFAEAGLSVFGIRSYEQPAYTVRRELAPGVELRAYPARVAAETAIADGGDGEAFGRLFRYITGANGKDAAMRMTAPVEQSAGRMIAMTVPVELASEGARRMRFFLPKEEAADPPVPSDPKVRIVTLPAATVAALRFSGTLDKASRAGAAARLRGALARAGVAEAGTASILSYDPPFAIPFLRRNEVVIPVAGP